MRTRIMMVAALPVLSGALWQTVAAASPQPADDSHSSECVEMWKAVSQLHVFGNPEATAQFADYLHLCGAGSRERVNTPVQPAHDRHSPRCQALWEAGKLGRYNMGGCSADVNARLQQGLGELNAQLEAQRLAELEHQRQLQIARAWDPQITIEVKATPKPDSIDKMLTAIPRFDPACADLQDTYGRKHCDNWNNDFCAVVRSQISVACGGR